MPIHLPQTLSSAETRLTWRVCEQCLPIEAEPWQLSWVSPTLRRPQQLDKVSRRLWKHCWTLSWPGLREVLPPSERSRHPRAHQPKPGPGRFDSPTPGGDLPKYQETLWKQKLGSTKYTRK